MQRGSTGVKAAVVYLICHPMQYRYIMNLRRHLVGHNDSLVGSVDVSLHKSTMSRGW
jgi:hypothetical protein